MIQFIADVFDEVGRAVAKFPHPNPTLAALTEETGELARAVLHIREKKSDDWQTVYREAVQVAAMACRVALEGDPTVGATPAIGSRIPTTRTAEWFGGA